MELTSQVPNASYYVSAPTSPGGCSLSSIHFYSAPTSPTKRVANDSFRYDSGTANGLDDFEFETSRKFGIGWEFETSKNFEYLVDDDDEQQQHKQKERVCGDSLPTMAFADELFSNGLVLPLKLPPRLQHSQRSILSSPRSPSSILRFSFARRMVWNDEYDPFMVALENVREEKRGRSHHRRTRSHSPFRGTTLQWSNTGECKQHQHKQESPQNQQLYVQHQTKQMGPSPKGPTTPKGLPFGRRVRPVKMGNEASINPTMTPTPTPGPTMKTDESSEETGGTSIVETRMQRVKGLLLRYASFGREKNNEAKKENKSSGLWKPSYFKRMSFKFQGNAESNGKKRMSGEPSKMVVVQYRSRLPLCLGYGMGSPRNMK